MRTQLQKWGNSLAIRIPREAVRSAKLRQGEALEVEVVRPGHLKVRVSKKKRRLTLAQLVKGITKDNRHEEIDWGPPRGNEVW